MKKNPLVMIIRTTRREDCDCLTLKQCGFKVGDLVEVDGYYSDGNINVHAIRNGDGHCVLAGDNIGLNPSEFVVVEGVV